MEIHAYQDVESNAIVDFRYQYNYFIANLAEQIPTEKLETKCHPGGSDPVTLAFVIEDYVLHLQHHIDHLLKRPVVTRYPSAATVPAGL